MDFSVVIPCYNAERWIAGAIHSAARQTHLPKEIVVIDDGSSDGSIDSIMSSGVAVKLLRTHRANGAGARNVGIQSAASDWIAFLDADDEWDQNHLENAVAMLRSSHDVAYVSEQRFLYVESGEFGVQPVWPLREGGGHTHRDWAETLRVRARLPMAVVIVRRDRLLEIGGLDTQQVRRHDIDMWMRVIHGQTWAYHPHVTGTYRKLMGSVSYTNWASSQYYMLRAAVKNFPAYSDTALAGYMNSLARNAVSAGFTDGAPGEWKPILELARPYLSAIDRLIFSASSLAPHLFRHFNLIRRRLSQIDSSNNPAIRNLLA